MVVNPGWKSYPGQSPFDGHFPGNFSIGFSIDACFMMFSIIAWAFGTGVSSDKNIVFLKIIFECFW